MAEKLRLKWNDFQENLELELRQRREDMEFADVTLACADGQQLEAHKLILTSASSFFTNLLKKNKHPHPLIIMTNVGFQDLNAILDFIYYGEVNICQQNLGAFMTTAEELEVKGLTLGVLTKGSQMSNPKPTLTENNVETIKHEEDNVSQENVWSKEEEEPTTEPATEATWPTTNQNTEENSFIDNNIVLTSHQILDAKVKSMLVYSQKSNRGNRPGKQRVCKMCGKEGEMGDIVKHIEAYHITGTILPCNLCDKVFRTRHNLRGHKSRQHRNENSFKEILANSF